MASATKATGWKWATLALLILGLALTAGAGRASAQNAPSGDYTAGPFKLRVTFDRDTFKSAQEFYLTVERLDGPAGDWNLDVTSEPSRSTSATPVKYSGDFHTSEPDKRLVKLQIPISGNWSVRLSLQSGTSTGQVSLPVMRVEPPPIIANWLAWLIGLTPVLGLLGFAFGQWRQVINRRREKQLSEDIHT